jgi:hypothetical protein
MPTLLLGPTLYPRCDSFTTIKVLEILLTLVQNNIIQVTGMDL